MTKTIKLVVSEICFYDVDIPVDELPSYLVEKIKGKGKNEWTKLVGGTLWEWLNAHPELLEDPEDPELYDWRVR